MSGVEDAPPAVHKTQIYPALLELFVVYLGNKSSKANELSE